MKKRMTLDKCRVLVIFMELAVAVVAQAELFVYEGFDYTTGKLDGKDGGTGFAGPWIDDTHAFSLGEAFVYDSSGNTNYSGAFHEPDPTWDGVVDNLTATGGYAALSPFSDAALGHNRINASRLMARSAGEMAADNGGVLWVAAACHFPNDYAYNAPGIALTDGCVFAERSRYMFGSLYNNAVGVGNGTVNLWPPHLKAVFWANAEEVAGIHITNISKTEDNIIILKYEFGPVNDTISAWYFKESETLDEATFDTNAVSLVSSIDEYALNTLSFSLIGVYDAFDEFRIGTTFNDVIGILPPPPKPGSLIYGK